MKIKKLLALLTAIALLTCWTRLAINARAAEAGFTPLRGYADSVGSIETISGGFRFTGKGAAVYSKMLTVEKNSVFEFTITPKLWNVDPSADPNNAITINILNAPTATGSATENSSGLQIRLFRDLNGATQYPRIATYSVASHSSGQSVETALGRRLGLLNTPLVDSPISLRLTCSENVSGNATWTLKAKAAGVTTGLDGEGYATVADFTPDFTSSALDKGWYTDTKAYLSVQSRAGKDIDFDITAITLPLHPDQPNIELGTELGDLTGYVGDTLTADISGAFSAVGGASFTLSADVGAIDNGTWSYKGEAEETKEVTITATDSVNGIVQTQKFTVKFVRPASGWTVIDGYATTGNLLYGVQNGTGFSGIGEAVYEKQIDITSTDAMTFSIKPEVWKSDQTGMFYMNILNKSDVSAAQGVNGIQIQITTMSHEGSRYLRLVTARIEDGAVTLLGKNLTLLKVTNLTTELELEFKKGATENNWTFILKNTENAATIASISNDGGNLKEDKILESWFTDGKGYITAGSATEGIGFIIKNLSFAEFEEKIETPGLSLKNSIPDTYAYINQEFVLDISDVFSAVSETETLVITSSVGKVENGKWIYTPDKAGIQTVTLNAKLGTATKSATFKLTAVGASSLFKIVDGYTGTDGFVGASDGGTVFYGNGGATYIKGLVIESGKEISFQFTPEMLAGATDEIYFVFNNKNEFFGEGTSGNGFIVSYVPLNDTGTGARFRLTKLIDGESVLFDPAKNRTFADNAQTGITYKITVKCTSAETWKIYIDDLVLGDIIADANIPASLFANGMYFGVGNTADTLTRFSVKNLSAELVGGGNASDLKDTGTGTNTNTNSNSNSPVTGDIFVLVPFLLATVCLLGGVLAKRKRRNQAHR